MGALSYLERSVQALELQKAKLGGGREAKERFSSKYADYYRDLIEVEVELKKREDALNTLERFRARSLLEMLAERDMDFSRDAPIELIREQRELSFRYSSIQEELSGLSPEKDGEKIEELLKELEGIRKSGDELMERMKRSSPRLASLQYPEPLEIGGIKALLDKETLFLSYSCGEEETILFALLNGVLETYKIPISREKLQREVIQLRRLLSDPKSGIKLLSEKCRELYDILLKPAEGLIKRSRLIIVCPDGALHYIPFGVLKPKRSKYLIEEKAVINVISGTVLSELKRAGKPERDTIIAFGAPAYPQDGSGYKDAIVRAMTGGRALSLLPSSEEEVMAIGELYKPDSKVYLGAAATEDEAKSINKGTSKIHLACHGIIDERFPLNSGLALTIPEKTESGKENGILQAWEIFEGMRIEADLVVLSACETGLGKEMGGEGMIGLTRAFQYAGAKTVLSSLWSVSDKSTGVLMEEFYKSLKSGRSKAESIRQAQLYLLNNKVKSKSGETEKDVSKRGNSPFANHNFTHPFYWAPFILNGDW